MASQWPNALQKAADNLEVWAVYGRITDEAKEDLDSALKWAFYRGEDWQSLVVKDKRYWSDNGECPVPVPAAPQNNNSSSSNPAPAVTPASASSTEGAAVPEPATAQQQADQESCKEKDCQGKKKLSPEQYAARGLRPCGCKLKKPEGEKVKRGERVKSDEELEKERERQARNAWKDGLDEDELNQAKRERASQDLKKAKFEWRCHYGCRTFFEHAASLKSHMLAVHNIHPATSKADKPYHKCVRCGRNYQVGGNENKACQMLTDSMCKPPSEEWQKRWWKEKDCPKKDQDLVDTFGPGASRAGSGLKPSPHVRIPLNQLARDQVAKEQGKKGGLAGGAVPETGSALGKRRRSEEEDVAPKRAKTTLMTREDSGLSAPENALAQAQSTSPAEQEALWQDALDSLDETIPDPGDAPAGETAHFAGPARPSLPVQNGLSHSGARQLPQVNQSWRNDLVGEPTFTWPARGAPVLQANHAPQFGGQMAAPARPAPPVQGGLRHPGARQLPQVERAFGEGPSARPNAQANYAHRFGGQMGFPAASMQQSLAMQNTPRQYGVPQYPQANQYPGEYVVAGPSRPWNALAPQPNGSYEPHQFGVNTAPWTTAPVQTSPPFFMDPRQYPFLQPSQANQQGGDEIDAFLANSGWY